MLLRTARPRDRGETGRPKTDLCVYSYFTRCSTNNTQLPPLPSLETIPSQLSNTSVHPSTSFGSTNHTTTTHSSSQSIAPSQPSSQPYPNPSQSYQAQAYGPIQVFPPIQPQPAPTFGVPLAVQMARDGVEHPRILTKCAAAIEKHGLDNVGIYRLSGTTSRVRELRGALDRGKSHPLVV
jgi:hypothetical protein